MARQLALRIHIEGAPPGIDYALQKGRGNAYETVQVRAGLKADGVEIGAMKPVQVKVDDLRDGARVISFGPDLSAVAGEKLTVND